MSELRSPSGAARLRPRWLFAAAGGALLVAADAAFAWDPPWPWRASALVGAGVLFAVAAELRRPPRIPRAARARLKWLVLAAAAAALVAYLPALGTLRPFILIGGAFLAGAAGLQFVSGGHDVVKGGEAGFPLPEKELWRRPLDELLAQPELTRFATERWVETPWVAERLRRGTRVLDLGFVNGDPLWHGLLRQDERQVYGLDLASGAVPGIDGALGDVRAMPFADESFDAVVAISTIEHVGCDNSIYEVGRDRRELAGDFAAMTEIARVLRPGGRALVTVPFGAAEDHGWFRQYGGSRLDQLAAAFGGDARIDYFVYRQGWRRAGRKELAAARYGAGEAPAATGVACLELQKA